MIHVNFQQIRTLVNYSESTEKLASTLAINKHIREFIRCKPSWSILPQEKTNIFKAWKEIILFIDEGGGVARQILRHMSTMSLRPIIFPELVAIINNDLLSNYSLVCLGTMWGNLGREQQIFREENTCHLTPFGTHWPGGTCFPAIHYSGLTNPLPGMIK